MPWPLQCTHERAELSVDLFSVGVGSTGDVLCSASGWPQKLRQQIPKLSAADGEIATQAQE